MGYLKVLEVLSEYAASVFSSGISRCNLWFGSPTISLKSLSDVLCVSFQGLET